MSENFVSVEFGKMMGVYSEFLRVDEVIKPNGKKGISYKVTAVEDCEIIKPTTDEDPKIPDLRMTTLKKGESIVLTAFELGLTLADEQYNGSCISATGRKVYFFFGMFNVDQIETTVPLAVKIGYAKDDDDVDLTDTNCYVEIDDLLVNIRIC